MDWFTHLAPIYEQGSYFAVFIVLVLCGLGLPIPEEITFLVSGYVVDKMGGSLVMMMVVGVFGVLCGDVGLYLLARKYGLALLRKWPFRLVFTQKRVEKGKTFFRNHGSKAVFFAGFFAGIRASVYFLSSAMGVNFWTYIFWDLIRALLTCPISIWFGYEFGSFATEYLHRYRMWVFSVLGIALIIVLIREFLLRRATKKNLTENPPSK
ncbi:MAG: DedA family protein [Candidatus Riflebacteria bacterium]|nr:DedA family protein [Candidatus Riflebacteria bacterium]